MPAARAPAALAAAGAFALLCCWPCAVSATDSTDVAVAVGAEGERGSVPLAFAFTIGAGLCTTVGGALSFLGNVEDKRILAVCLALSAGVMLYVPSWPLACCSSSSEPREEAARVGGTTRVSRSACGGLQMHA